MPTAQFDHRIILSVPPPEVWVALQEPDTWAGLGPVQKVWDAAFEEDRLCGFKWSVEAGPRTIEGTATTRQSMPNELMVLDVDAGDFTGLVTTELEPEAGGTGVNVIISLEASGMLSSLFWGPITKVIGSGLPEQVEGLAAKIEGDPAG